MRDSLKLAAVKGTLAKLREKHLEDLRDARFVGWTPEKLEGFEKREGTRSRNSVIRLSASTGADAHASYASIACRVAVAAFVYSVSKLVTTAVAPDDGYRRREPSPAESGSQASVAC